MTYFFIVLTFHQNIQLKLYYQRQYFSSLENSIFNHKDKGNIVIIGDPNAWTGIEDHTMCFDNHISQLSPDTNSIQDES